MFQKKVCVDCHFLSKYLHTLRDSKFNLNHKDRENIKNKYFYFLTKYNKSLYCYKGEWDEDVSGAEDLRNDRTNNLTNENRNNCRFYHIYKKGATYQAIEDNIDYDEIKNEKRRLFKEKIYIVIITAIVGIVIGGISLCEFFKPMKEVIIRYFTS